MRAKARQDGNIVNFGRIFELCHEKGSELEDGDPEKKMKGRSVLLGDNVKGQDFNGAEVLELGSSPPTIESARALDAMGSLPGYRVKNGRRQGGLYAIVIARRRDVGHLTRKQVAETLARQASATSCAIDLGPLRSHRRRRILGRTLRSTTRVHWI